MASDNAYSRTVEFAFSQCARLIAAAPELLAELKRIHDLHGCDDETLAVIAKAEGLI